MIQNNEISVFFPESVSSNWLGGLNYYFNLFTALSKTSNPKIVPYILPLQEKSGEKLLSVAKVLPLKKDFSYYFTKKILFPLTKQNFDIRLYALKKFAKKISVVSHSDLECDTSLILWIADFQHIHLPQMFTKEQILERNERLRKSVKNAKIVILSSEDAKSDFEKIYPEHKEKARVLHFIAIPENSIYEKTDEIAEITKQKFNLPTKYFYCPNQFWKHKNHKTLFQAISILKKQGVNIKVVFTGNTVDGRNPEYFDELMNFAKEENILDNILILGIIERIEMFYLMRNCISLINPSLFEGWSSTVEEAKSIGKNIILSDLNVHKEQNPPKGTFFAATNPKELASILEEKWNNGESKPDFDLEEIAKRDLENRIVSFGKVYQDIILSILEQK